MFALFFLSLLLPALVAAHGYVYKVTIDGTSYQGNPVGTTSTVSSVIRQINTNSPVKGADNPYLNCGQNAQLAADVANANPGSTVQVYWVGGVSGDSDFWPHNTGPIMHYMAKCDGSCASYNSSNAEWFKISEQGQKPGGSTWYQADLMTGSPATVTIPATLAPGDYLLRSELIALQLAVTEGGAEFYPACIQLSVGGSQTSQPTSSEEVTLPGGYQDTNPGILTPDVYNPGFSYQFPGPAVVSFASGNSTSGSSGGSGASSSPPAPTPSSPSAPGSSTSPTPSTPGNAGGNPPSTPSSGYPTPTSTGGSSTCMRKRSIPQPRISVDRKRMHRRRYRTSH
ncbi:glycoside hydrolase family 61 protein [Tylopilus felleus]